MTLTKRALPFALAFSVGAGSAFAQDQSGPLNIPEPANDTLSFQCDQLSFGDVVPFDPYNPDYIADLAAALYPATVRINAGPVQDDFPFGLLPRDSEVRPAQEMPKGSLGSGYVIDARQGLILTNAHVVQGPPGAELGYSVVFTDLEQLDYAGTEVRAELIGMGDAENGIDLAVLKVNPDDLDFKLTCVNLADIQDLRPGQTALAIGSPLGQTASLTVGRISHTKRVMDNPLHEYVQTDAAINRGNSGGALFNMDGDVAGMNTLILSQSGGSIGLGYALPSDVIAKYADQIIRADDDIKHGWLGVAIQEISPDITQESGVQAGGGVYIPKVFPDTPAIDGGMQEGDIVLLVNDKPVGSARELSRSVAEHRPGESITITIQRGDQLIDLPIELGERAAGMDATAEKTPEEEDPNAPKARPLTPLTPEPDTQLEDDGSGAPADPDAAPPIVPEGETPEQAPAIPHDGPG